MDKKQKKAKINPINKKDNKPFQYAITFTLNSEEIEKHLQIITKTKTFVDKYTREETNYPSEKDDWENFRKII